jgi:hypothetical protein
MKIDCLSMADEHRLTTPYTATGSPIYAQCKLMLGDLLESTQLESNLSLPYYQTNPQDLQSPSPPDHLSYPMVDLAFFEAELTVYAATEYNGYCFSAPFVQPPICWGDASFIYSPASWVECGRQSVDLTTPYMPCIYSTPLPSIEGEPVQTGGSPDNAMGSNWGAWNSDSNKTGLAKSLNDSAVAGLRSSRRGKKANEGMRTTPPACSEKCINSTPCPPCKPFKCQLNAQGSQEKEVCGQRFKRIEHLRRHMSTVHSNLRTECKVPLCRKGFSRWDNLYDHYWTHVDLGKPGRNLKLSLGQLEQILWPRDRRILLVLESRMSRPRRPSRWDR